MTDTKKPLKSFSWGGWNIAEWENPTQDGRTFKSFTLSKNAWNNQTQKIERVGSIGINKKEDFSIILHILEKSRETLKENTIMNYGIRFNMENEKIKDKFIVKFYKDKDGKDQSQYVNFDWLDLVFLRTLIRVFEDKMVFTTYTKSSPSFSPNNSVDEPTDNGEFIDEKVEDIDEIPF